MTVLIRPAKPRDRDAVIDLHVGLSRQAYAHIFSADYLGERLAEEKRALWSQRLADAPDPKKLTINVAEVDGMVRAFSCFVFEDDDAHGAYLHNLYVHGDAQRRGIARQLIIAGLDHFPPEFAQRGVHLEALEKNLPACALYERIGGTVIERVTIPHPPLPPVIALRFGWPSPDALRREVAA